MKFHSKPIYNENYLKTKLKPFNEVVNTIFLKIFLFFKIPKESIDYICVEAINIHSVMIINKKTILKFIWKNVNVKQKKKKMVKFIDDSYCLVDFDYPDDFDSSSSE